MGFRCGIVGLPNAGKSTLFNALTSAAVAAENYPFCTIEPNKGVVEVPDQRLARIAQLSEPQKIVSAVIEFVDIAGLVSGASHGEGLGNRFLGHLREVDAIAHVVRGFEREDVSHVTGHVNPVADIHTVDTELGLADIETLERALERAKRGAQSGDDNQRMNHKIFEAARSVIGTDRGLGALGPDVVKRLTPLGLLTAKPVVYIVNLGGASHDLALMEKVRAHANSLGSETVEINAAIEQEIAGLGAEEREEFVREFGLGECGLDRVVQAGYRLLSLHTFFTIRSQELRAWAVPIGTSAIDAAEKIHTDSARGFIRAETISFDDFICFGGEKGAREAGRLRLEGRDYVVNDGDILNFRFNV